MFVLVVAFPLLYFILHEKGSIRAYHLRRKRVYHPPTEEEWEQAPRPYKAMGTELLIAGIVLLISFFVYLFSNSSNERHSLLTNIMNCLNFDGSLISLWGAFAISVIAGGLYLRQFRYLTIDTWSPKRRILTFGIYIAVYMVCCALCILIWSDTLENDSIRGFVAITALFVTLGWATFFRMPQKKGWLRFGGPFIRFKQEKTEYDIIVKEDGEYVDESSRYR